VLSYESADAVGCGGLGGNTSHGVDVGNIDLSKLKFIRYKLETKLNNAQTWTAPKSLAAKILLVQELHKNELI
jgi:hypothetical protein